jgi:uroporphyrin-III C-methyltransferase/precorrin-2 dehydrogenase/sirohydrochlorin ferrochelatase
VVAPEVIAPLEEQARAQRLALERRRYREGEAAGYPLVLAATDDPAVNRRVFEDADAAGVWVNVADDPELCSFHLPARVRRGALELAVGSGGSAPFATRRIRQLLERRFGSEWTVWSEAAAEFRAMARDEGLSPEQRERAFDRFFAETVDPERLSARVPSQAEEQAWLDAAVQRPRLEAVGGRSVERRRPRGRLGLVSLVGAGPGCAGLLTLRGRQRLLAADAVLYDRLAALALPCDLPDTVELLPVGKRAGEHPIPQDEINALLVRLASEGRRVVRLKGGDPDVFGRGGEEAEALCAAGIPFEIVPGVTSGVAAPAWMGVPVTHRREAVRLTFVTAHESSRPDAQHVRWDLLAGDPHATIVGYMGLSSLPRAVAGLLEGGMAASTPAAMVQNGTTAAQRSVVSTLGGLAAAVERAGLESPALFVIGSVVRHAERLDWVRQQPLAGQRLAVPAAATRLVESLESAGAEVVAVPFPVTAAARVVMDALPLTGCVVGTPADVETFDDERDGAGWQGRVVSWCLGRETAERARQRDWPAVEQIAAGADADELVEWIRERQQVA